MDASRITYSGLVATLKANGIDPTQAASLLNKHLPLPKRPAIKNGGAPSRKKVQPYRTGEHILRRIFRLLATGYSVNQAYYLVVVQPIVSTFQEPQP